MARELATVSSAWGVPGWPHEGEPAHNDVFADGCCAFASSELLPRGGAGAARDQLLWRARCRTGRRGIRGCSFIG